MSLMVGIMANFNSIEIEDYEHFVSLTEKFDKDWNTVTYILQEKLTDIADLIWKNTVHGTLDNEIKYCFGDRKVIWTNKKDINPDRMVKMISFKSMIDSLKKDRRFVNPICCNYFDTKKFSIHPGGTRMIFKDVVEEPVTLVITDYSGELKKDYSDIQFIPYNRRRFDTTGLEFMTADNSDGKPRGFTSACGDKMYKYKELKTTDDTLGMYENGNPHALPEPIKLELQEDSVYVDNQLIIRKENKEWQLAM